MPYQYLLGRAKTGLSVHLMEAHTSATLCGREARWLELQVPFEMNGCTQCAKAALKAGTNHVIDVDGQRISLDGFQPWA